ncbi:hypothetical protein TSC_c16860 [Thermus scotoductus SA-01]|uniref:Uncharacterized protein n=1 Tax=Thermus scotoductus (strain ATCC 700910 / SA-01) TaxID=743525 RepID=E8PLF3_THESS|nr:hypothetical protein TSC_c16860 [Thermus scotoductus SA-01]
MVARNTGFSATAADTMKRARANHRFILTSLPLPGPGGAD